jgi:hypothetical protein
MEGWILVCEILEPIVPIVPDIEKPSSKKIFLMCVKPFQEKAKSIGFALLLIYTT